MTSPISAINGLSGTSGISALSGTDSTPAATGSNSVFANMLSNSLEHVQNLQNKTDQLAVQVADGTLSDPAQYTMASTESSLALELTMAVRNKAVEAFQEIMRMQA